MATPVPARRKRRLIALTIVGLAFAGTDSFRAKAMDIWGRGEVPRLTDLKDVPRTLPEMWQGYNESYDKNNPLEEKILKTWETPDSIVVNWVELAVGTFQGKKSIVCGFWAYPKSAKNLPAILFVNGGPQTGSEDTAVNYARLGYACFNPNNNQDEKMGGETEGLPNTDWGALNASPNQGAERWFTATDKTIDAVPSPRNDWLFPRQISGRRIISFMMQQSQVNPGKIGITGFSTGGSLTACESLDPRVTAVVCQNGGCGGKLDVHEFINGNAADVEKEFEDKYGKLFREFDEGGFWKYMRAPVLLRSASDDFHCPDWNSVQAINMVKSDRRYVSCANFNHAAPPEVQISDYLWFQDKLKGEFKFPETPKSKLSLKQADGIPVFQVTLPSTKLKFKRVEMFYTDGRNTLTRFWITGDPKKNADGTWQIKCPVNYSDEPLFAFANVIYEIDPIKAPNHSYNGLSEMAVTSDYAWAWPNELLAAGIKPQPASNRLIDDFSHGGRDWTSDQLGQSTWWSISTRKISSPFFTAPKGAELVFEFNSPEAGTKIAVEVHRSFMEANFMEDMFYGFCDLPKQGWNTVRVKVSDLHNPYGWQLDGWDALNTLTVRAAAGLKEFIEEKVRPRVQWTIETINKNGQNPSYTANLGKLPDKLSAWNESYYTSAGGQFARGATMTADDLFFKTHFGNMRWEGGEFVQRAKPEVVMVFVKPEAIK